MSTPAQSRARYQREAILAASPARLVTLLYDRLVLDLSRAAAAQESSDWFAASKLLLHAQAIVAELSASLDVRVWNGGERLQALYTYTSQALVLANINRDIGRTREALDLIVPLRDAWLEASAESITPFPVAGPDSRTLGIA